MVELQAKPTLLAQQRAVEVLARARRLGADIQEPTPGELAARQAQTAWLGRLRYLDLDAVPPEDRIRLARAKLCCDRARVSAVELDGAEAQRQLALAESLGGDHLLSAQAKLLARSDLAASEAAVCYQAGDLAVSQERLFEACRLDGHLVCTFGLDQLRAHRLHLLGKMVQLLAGRQLYTAALTMAASSLLFVAGRSVPQWPLRESWAVGSWEIDRTSTPADPIRRMLFRQLAVETGAALLHAPFENEKQAIQEFAAVISGPLEEMHDGGEDAMSCSYLRALCTSRASADEGMLGWAEFLVHGRANGPTLWLLGSLGAAKACASINGHAATMLRQEVYAELAVHLPFPSALRRRWKKLMPAPESAQEAR